VDFAPSWRITCIVLGRFQALQKASQGIDDNNCARISLCIVLKVDAHLPNRPGVLDILTAMLFGSPDQIGAL
jgi:hypothetical protein